MNGKLFLLCTLFLPLSVSAVERSAALDSLRIDVNDLSQGLKSQRSEIEILTEKLQNLQAALDALKDEPKSAKNEQLEQEKFVALEKRVAQIEKNSKTFVTDLKTLKDHCNESNVAKYEQELKNLEASFSSDIKTLKSSMQTMLALLEGKTEKTYVVKPGDSLGKIALDHQVSIKTLKQANHLESDQICVGQKILIPLSR